MEKKSRMAGGCPTKHLTKDVTHKYTANQCLGTVHQLGDAVTRSRMPSNLMVANIHCCGFGCFALILILLETRIL